MLRTSLVAVPAFMRVEPVRTSGPVSWGDGDVGGLGERGVGDAGEADGEGSEGAGVGDCSEDVGGAAAGGDADESVVGVKPAATRSAAPCWAESSAASAEVRSAESPPAMMPWKRVGGTEKVGGHSEASRTPRRPLVPAPM